MTGTTPFHQYTTIIALTRAFEQGTASLNRPAAAHKADNHMWKKMDKCLDRKPENRPTATDMRVFFNGLGFQDDRHQDRASMPRVRTDKTAIDNELVYKTLQRVSVPGAFVANRVK
jgi:hypothetical protein